ncbi:MAG TPA: nucleoside 2-deoxyribosyltransferase [Micromonosporaceae bacterium]|nr:nucleoside 2-deoxyribosyltransferase [Micromonosporaceae bacterium]
MNLTGRRVFLAAPYSQWVNPATGLVDEHRRTCLDALRVSFIAAGARVFSAHHNERWGAGWLPAEECTPADFRAMRVADVVCAIVGSPPSGGVAVELGWASALAKPVLVVKAPDSACTPLIDGLGSITRTAYLTDDGVWGERFFAEALALIATIADADPVDSPHECAESAFVGHVEGRA